MKDAKSFLTGVFPLRAETQEGLTNLLVSQQLYDLPADYLQTYRDKVNAVTLEDVERVAKKYISPDKIAIVIVGDVEKFCRKSNRIQPKSKFSTRKAKRLTRRLIQIRTRAKWRMLTANGI